MGQRQLTLRHGLYALRHRQSRSFAEDHQIQQRIAHQPIASVQPTGSLPRHKEVFHGRFAVDVDLHSSVLIVQRRINQDRVFADIDAVPGILANHGGEMLVQRAFAMLRLEQRGIQPHADASGRHPDAATFFTFPNDGG